MSKSVITILTADHRTVEKLFKAFEKTTDRAHTTRRDLVDTISRELSIHASVEESVVYPRFRQAGAEMKDEVLEALEEHHAIKQLLADLGGMDPSEQRYEAKVTVLIEQTRHHVEEEEGELFVHAKRALSAAQLGELGDAVEAAKRVAPTRPHPSAPDEPPGNLASPALAAVDAAKDAGDALISTTGRAVRGARQVIGDKR